MMEKPILDACCGGRMFYFDKHDSRVLFQDIRDVETTLCDGRHFEVKPDIQADFTDMPYPDNSFSMVVFDPPHLLRNVGKSKWADMYGSLNPKAKPSGCGMLPRVEARRLPHLQVERDGHQGLGDTETHAGEAGIRAYIR